MCATEEPGSDVQEADSFGGCDAAGCFFVFLPLPTLVVHVSGGYEVPFGSCSLAEKKTTDAQRTPGLFVFEAIIQHSAPPRDRRAEQLLAHLSLSSIFFGNHIVTFIAFFSPPLHLVFIVLIKKIELPCRSYCVELLLNCRSGKVSRKTSRHCSTTSVFSSLKVP